MAGCCGYCWRETVFCHGGLTDAVHAVFIMVLSIMPAAVLHHCTITEHGDKVCNQAKFAGERVEKLLDETANQSPCMRG